MESISGVVGILISLALLMWLAYRDVSVLILAPVCAMLAVVLDGNLPVLASYTQIFMASVGTFIRDYFPLFLLGAVFGKLMEDSGFAARISGLIVRAAGRERTLLAVVLSCGVLTYGGVSLFVVVFTVFPLARSLFQATDLPRRLIPATIALGSFTFTMTALPGTVQIQNQLPMSAFRTTAFAAPGLGCIGGLLMLVLGMLWLNARVRSARRRGEGFGTVAASTADAEADGNGVQVSPWICCAPLVCAVLMNFILSQCILPRWDTSYLSEEQFGRTELSRVLGSWSTILSLISACLLVILLHYRSADRLKRALSEGARAALLPVFNTASEVGYGNTIKTLAGFAVVRDFVTGLAPGNPLISEAIAVNTLAAVTGSASGGLSIALNTLGETYYQRGLEAGINPELLHRVASMSCGGLDSLPHNGAVITLLLICGVSHRQGYADVGVVTVLGPICATVCVIVLGSLFGSF